VYFSRVHNLAKMKAVILAGGKGTRLAEETGIKPKPLVEAKGKPLLWHVMQNYYFYGVTDFIILSGYKGNQIRDYFANFWLHESDVTFDLKNSILQIHKVRGLPWKVTIIDTGLDTNTGGRIAQLRDILDEDFLLTYGDGVSDVNMEHLLNCHQQNSNYVTLTAVQPPARFGALNLLDEKVISFEEKPKGDGAWVNGGFFVVDPKVFDYISGNDASFEADVLPKLAKDGKLGSYKHSGFWQPVDTIRDLQRLELALEKDLLPWM